MGTSFRRGLYLLSQGSWNPNEQRQWHRLQLSCDSDRENPAYHIAHPVPIADKNAPPCQIESELLVELNAHASCTRSDISTNSRFSIFVTTFGGNLAAKSTPICPVPLRVAQLTKAREAIQHHGCHNPAKGRRLIQIRWLRRTVAHVTGEDQDQELAINSGAYHDSSRPRAARAGTGAPSVCVLDLIKLPNSGELPSMPWNVMGNGKEEVLDSCQAPCASRGKWQQMHLPLLP